MSKPYVSAVLALLAGAAVASAQLSEPSVPPQLLPPPQPVPGLPVPPEIAPLPQPVGPFPMPGDMGPPSEEAPPDSLFDQLGKVFLTPRFWVSGAYLHWWISEPSVPPLITHGST